MEDHWLQFAHRVLAIEDHLLRFAQRVSGPMKVRFLLQPTMAAILAIRSGLKDARAGNPPYFWTLATDPTARAALLKDGWKSVGKVFVLAFTIDIVYQLIELHFLYPAEAVTIAFLLAIVPYLIVRGLVTRIVSRKWPWRRTSSGPR
jgi:hypothetical protein